MNQRKVGGKNGLTCLKVSWFVFLFFLLIVRKDGINDELQLGLASRFSGYAQRIRGWSTVSSRQLNKDCLQTKRKMLAIEFAQKVATLLILIYLMNIQDCEKG